MKRRAQLFLLILTLILVTSQSVFAGGPWKGRVIDIGTKEPLENVVVVVIWERVWRTPAGPSGATYRVIEVITDKDGRFEVPAYTPINLLPVLTYFEPPRFIIYKPGYGSLKMALGDYLTGGNEKAPYLGNMIFYEIKVSHGVIELQALKTKEDRLKTIPSGPGDLRSKDLPLLYNAVNDEYRQFGLGEVGDKKR